MATFNETIDTTGSYTFDFPANGENNTVNITVDLPSDINALTFAVRSAQNILVDDGEIETVVLNLPPGFSLDVRQVQTFGNEEPPLQRISYFVRNEDNLIIGNGEITANNIDINTDFIPCFTPGSLILCADGVRRPVETLKAGDIVETLDSGPCAIREVARSTISKTALDRFPKYAPIFFEKDAVGNDAAFSVSPQHRLLLRGAVPELLFDEAEVLVPALLLVNGTTIQQHTPLEPVEYIHLLLETHEIVCADGIWSETLVPGCRAMICAGGLTLVEDVMEIEELPSARPSLKGWEGRLIAADFADHLPEMAEAFEHRDRSVWMSAYAD
ncbi:Hint domain-containing protein [Aestuariibius insulae]|uniref:Hint domain-containing protein n=1 Tax=Aestuariibius insulae TaxID=2058287 RepID=UPI00345E4EB3